MTEFDELEDLIEGMAICHLPMRPRANGSIPCECGDSDNESYTRHQIRVFSEAVWEAGYRIEKK